jgi:uncharacterized protein YjbI with pentapeptide repeats
LGADISYSNLSYAWLVNADLSNANLKGADFTGANLERTIFNGANLTDAKGISRYFFLIC